MFPRKEEIYSDVEMLTKCHQFTECFERKVLSTFLPILRHLPANNFVEMKLCIICIIELKADYSFIALSHHHGMSCIN